MSPICSICLDNIILSNISDNIILDCQHIFHKKCVNKWLKISKTCPLCRKTHKNNLNKLDILKKSFFQLLCVICTARFYTYMHVVCHIYFTYRKNMTYIYMTNNDVRSVIIYEKQIRDKITFFWCILNITYIIFKYHIPVFRNYL